MKRITLLMITAIVVSSCQPQNPGAFVVSGKVEHVQPQLIYLEELPLDGSQPVVLDSATLFSNGSFELNTIGKEEGLYFINVQNGPQAIFINDNSHIRINLDANNFRHPDIEGSEATSSLYEFINTYVQKDSVIRSTYNKIDSVQKQNYTDSSVRDLQKQGLQQIASLNSYIKNFVNTCKSPAAIHFAISQSARTGSMPGQDLLALATAASDKFKQHKALALLKSRITMDAAQTDSPDYALLNQQAPDLTMPDVKGTPVSISNFKGKYVLVDFWASWCGPCRRENPNVVTAYNKYKNKNFTILGVSLDENKDAWLNAIKKDHLIWNHMSDLKQWESSAVSTYKINGIPFNVLIDPEGKIIASSLRGQELEQKLEEVLK